MEAGNFVVVHLVEPPEKYWGILMELGQAGVTLRSINLSSLDDWMSSVVHDDEPALGLATIFFPLRRVERMFLDEQIGQVESLCQMFERRVGKSVEDVLGLKPTPDDLTN